MSFKSIVYGDHGHVKQQKSKRKSLFIAKLIKQYQLMTRLLTLAILFTSILTSNAFAQMVNRDNTNEQNKPLKVGSEMPMLSHQMQSTIGKSLTLESIAGKNGYVVIFSCNACPFVVAWEDRYQSVASFASELGFQVVLVNSNEAKRTEDVQVDNFSAMVDHDKEKGYTEMGIYYLLDKNSVLADIYGAKVTPHVYLFDRNGVLQYIGAIDDNYKDASQVKASYLLDAMLAVHAGEPVKVTSTDAIGCSIKRIKK